MASPGEQRKRSLLENRKICNVMGNSSRLSQQCASIIKEFQKRISTNFKIFLNFRNFQIFEICLNLLQIFLKTQLHFLFIQNVLHYYKKLKINIIFSKFILNFTWKILENCLIFCANFISILKTLIKNICWVIFCWMFHPNLNSGDAPDVFWLF